MLEPEFKRLGATVVQATPGGTATKPKLTLMLRVGVDDTSQGRWRNFIHEILLHQKKDKGKAWTVDIGQTYYLDGESLRYLWRVIINGTGKDALTRAETRMRQSVIGSLSTGVEITSMPLVGRLSYSGKKTMGGYGYGDQPDPTKVH